MVTSESGVYAPQVFYGLSTDTKPVGEPNGSMFIEMDDSKVFFFNAESAQWVEWSKS